MVVSDVWTLLVCNTHAGRLPELRSGHRTHRMQGRSDRYAREITMKEITIEEMLALPRVRFIDRCKTYIKEARGGKLFECKNPHDCPLAIWVEHNGKKCPTNTMVSGTELCPLCGAFVCPTCKSHDAQPLSRVTGYLSNVNSWNSAKKQEFEDRTRYGL